MLYSHAGCHSHEAMKCLGGTGLIFTIIFTYFGFILLMVRSFLSRFSITLYYGYVQIAVLTFT